MKGGEGGGQGRGCFDYTAARAGFKGVQLIHAQEYSDLYSR